MRKIYVAEAMGELVCCSKSINKCRRELKKMEPELPSYYTILKSVKEYEGWSKNINGEDYYIRKTILL